MKTVIWFWLAVGTCWLTIPAWAQKSKTAKDDSLIVLSQQVLTQSPEQQIQTIPELLKKWERRALLVDTTWINLSLELARAYSKKNQQSVAIRLIKEVIRRYKSNTSFAKPEGLVKAYYRLSVYQDEVGNFVDARVTAEQGIKVGVEFPRSKWTSYLYTLLAYLLSESGDYEKAIQQADKGIQYGKQSEDVFGISNGLYEKSKALIKLGRISQTLPYLRSCIQLVSNKPKYAYDLSLYYATLAYVYQTEKNLDQSLLYFRRGIALNRQLNDSLGLGNNNIDLGYFLYEQGRYDQAIAPLQEAIKCHPTPFGKARALDNLGAVYWQQKKFEQAFTAYQQGFNFILARFPDKSITRLPDPKTVQISSHKEYLLTLIQDKADTWLDWGKTTGNRTYLRHALETYQLADQMIDFMRWEHTGTGSKLYWRQKTRGLYERAIETCYRLGDTEQAYRFFEKSRAVMLTDKLNELGAHDKLTPAQMAQENGFRQRITDLQTELSTLNADAKAYTDVRVKLSAEQEGFDGFVRQLEQSNPAYYRYKYDNATRSLADVQHWLQERSMSLVSYFVGDSGLYVLGVTAGGAQLLRQPVGDYKKNTAEFRQLLNDPAALNRQFPRYQALSFTLYRQLLAPLHLPEGRVVVSPDGFFLPFESLSRQAATASAEGRPEARTPDWLVNHYAFSYAYSARLMLKDRPNTTPDRAFFGMAPVQFVGGLSPLAGSDAVLRQIGGQVGSATVLTGSEATRRAFREGAPHARIIQLFTHADAGTQPGAGVVSNTDPSEPVLYFADSTLRLSDITGTTPFQADLLVLSACKTGVGVNQRGEGVFSLARGFAAAGVPSVLTTLWSVDNKATYRLTELFYKYFTDGHPKDAALQLAKAEFLKTATRAEQLPTNWAGLILVGNADPLPGPARWPYVAGSGLVLAGVGWLTRRKRRTAPKGTQLT